MAAARCKAGGPAGPPLKLATGSSVNISPAAENGGNDNDIVWA